MKLYSVSHKLGSQGISMDKRGGVVFELSFQWPTTTDHNDVIDLFWLLLLSFGCQQSMGIMFSRLLINLHIPTALISRAFVRTQ